MGYDARPLIRQLVTDAAFALLVMAYLAPIALADGGDAAAQPERITATAAQTITLPYTFEVIDFSGSDALTLPPIDFGGIAFINQAGSIAVTMFSLLDQYAILGLFVVIMAALGVVFWMWTTVSGRSSSAPALNLSGGVEPVADLYYKKQNYDLDYESSAMSAQADNPGTPIERRTEIRDSLLPGIESRKKGNRSNLSRIKKGANIFRKGQKL